MIAVLAVSGVVLGAWYMLWLVQRVFFGPLREPKTVTASPVGVHSHAERDVQISTGDHPVRDMNFREVLALAPLAVFVFWIGLVPGTFLQAIGPAVKEVKRQSRRGSMSSIRP